MCWKGDPRALHHLRPGAGTCRPPALVKAARSSWSPGWALSPELSQLQPFSHGSHFRADFYTGLSGSTAKPSLLQSGRQAVSPCPHAASVRRSSRVSSRLLRPEDSPGSRGPAVPWTLSHLGMAREAEVLHPGGRRGFTAGAPTPLPSTPVLPKHPVPTKESTPGPALHGCCEAPRHGLWGAQTTPACHPRP